MTAETPENEPEDRHPDSPSVEEPAQLRNSAAAVRGVLGPTLEKQLFSPNLHGVFGPLVKLSLAESVGIGAFSKAITGQFSIHGELLKRLTTVAGLGTTHAKLSLVLEPFTQAQQALIRYPVINSDLLKFAGVQQAQLNLLSGHLIKTADFGFDKQINKFAVLWATEQTGWLNFAARFKNLWTTFLPSNLEGVPLSDVEKVVMLDGIALYEVPRRDIAESLINAKSNSARREILGRRWKQIAADCRVCLDACETKATAHHVETALDAVDALEKGNRNSAQALAGNLLDTLIRKHLADAKPQLVPGKKTKTSDAYDAFTVRKYIALAPIWQAFQQYRPEKGDPIPRTFNRHATAHAVSPRQYSRRNAVQGLMLVCGLIRFIDEQAAAQQAA